MSRDPLSGASLFDHVRTYTQIGEHRTGTTGDLNTSTWIRGLMDGWGYESSLDPVPVELFEVTAGFLEIARVRYRADPEWYPTATPSGGVAAPMKMLSPGEDMKALNGKIWVVDVQMRRPVIPAEVKQQAVAAAEAGAVGVVMLLSYRTQELTGRGAHGEWGSQPWCPVPLVAVAAKHDPVRAAALEGATARLVLRGREASGAHAFNVSARLGKGDKTIVVTTPQSGMFRCGGERGGGLAVFLGLAEWASRQEAGVRYLFSTNTGHEQSGSGARKLLEDVAPPPDEVVGWLHLGSGVSTWLWREREDGTLERYAERSGIRNFGAVPSLVETLNDAFSPIPGLRPQSERFAGELRAYVERGYPGFGFWGYNRFGHTEADGPEQSDPLLLEPVARCLATALTAIAGSTGDSSRPGST